MRIQYAQQYYFIPPMLKNFSMEALSLLEKLVKIESSSGREERLASFILDYLHSLKYGAFMEGANVLVFPERDFIIASHMDTFKVLSTFSSDDEYAYGTGVCDAKASIAAILLALKKITVEKINFGVVFFHDEEGEGIGSKEYCKTYRPSMAVVMEPTNMTIANVQYGGLELKIRVMGRAAHGAFPEMGENAIEKCMDVIRKLLGVKRVKVSAQYIRGGSPEDFVIPDECEARIEIFFKPNLKVEDVLSRVKRILGSRDLELIVKDAYSGFMSNKTPMLLKEAMKSLGYKVKFSEMPSWTDAINLHEMAGCDVAIFGPGELYSCHTRGERVKIKDVIAAADILVALNNLLAKKRSHLK
ncbi:MAG: M20/M25/M40 family metallo-hydrolase [Candidatus Bathyarchaeia archaeon]